MEATRLKDAESNSRTLVQLPWYERETLFRCLFVCFLFGGDERVIQLKRVLLSSDPPHIEVWCGAQCAILVAAFFFFIYVSEMVTVHASKKHKTKRDLSLWLSPLIIGQRGERRGREGGKETLLFSSKRKKEIFKTRTGHLNQSISLSVSPLIQSTRIFLFSCVCLFGSLLFLSPGDCSRSARSVFRHIHLP